MNAESYHSGNRQNTIIELHGVVESFFGLCYAAGEKCAFYKESNSAEEIRSCSDAILADVTANPTLLFDPKIVDYPVIATGCDVRDYIFHAAYHPLQTFPKLVKIMTDPEIQNATRPVEKPEWGRRQNRNVICKDGSGCIACIRRFTGLVVWMQVAGITSVWASKYGGDLYAS